MNRVSPWIGLAVVLAISLYVFFGKGDPVDRVKLTIMYAAVVVVLLYSLVVLIAIATGEIPIGALLTESGGGASMSRFQLLIFTLIIALCFVLIAVHTNGLPEVPGGVLELLGVSASTYAVSKGIQAGSDLKSKIDPPAPPNDQAPPR